MENQRLRDRRRRNKNFDGTHRLLIEKAVELISELGTEALSISALARDSGINRSTVYYHFDSREVLIEAVRAWSSEQISKAFGTRGENELRVADAVGFVAHNPEVMKLWIDDFISAGDIRDRYPQWDEMATDFAAVEPVVQSAGEADPEALSAIMLAGALVGSRVYLNSVRPGTPADDAVERIARTHMWVLRRCGLA